MKKFIGRCLKLGKKVENKEKLTYDEFIEIIHMDLKCNFL